LRMYAVSKLGFLCTERFDNSLNIGISAATS
jgi:hypothetical protein